MEAIGVASALPDREHFVLLKYLNWLVRSMVGCVVWTLSMLALAEY